ncbi:TadE/TadG family type IV pilus assembly protein [Pseudoglutamicibacter albus]|uniref:TadE/TadG family type IV pilus assembly protein n=1 Tax=Pseudoglutamicibacter albus TaxID=98671 RepID=UPI003617D1C0
MRGAGSVTVEFAVLLPALVLLLAFVGAVATVGTAQVRAQHAAGIAAREEARERTSTLRE